MDILGEEGSDWGNRLESRYAVVRPVIPDPNMVIRFEAIETLSDEVYEGLE
jgi:hypothetical protein